MCQFKSFVITKAKIFHLALVDSHEDIIDYYDLPDDFKKIVRCEYTPDYNKDVSDLKTWNFKVYQDIIPDWFDREKTIKEIQKIIKPMIHKDENIKVITGETVILCGKSNLEKLIFGRAIISDSASVRASGSASVEAYGSSSVRAHDSAFVEDYRIKKS